VAPLLCTRSSLTSAPNICSSRRFSNFHGRRYHAGVFKAFMSLEAGIIVSRHFCKRVHRQRAHRVVRNSVRVEPASGQDVKAAAAITVRALSWTKGWLEQPNFSDDDYAFLAANEEREYYASYLANGQYQSTMLVAKVEEQAAKKAEPQGVSSFFSSSSQGPAIAGCIGCEIRCFQRADNKDLGVTAYDGGNNTVLRPVMADLAVSPEFRGRGLARKLVSALEDKVREWGYDEIILLVEATNFQARGLYDRLGYRLNDIKSSQETVYLDKTGGSRKLADKKTFALVLRKSLKGFPIDAFENFNWGWYVAVISLAAAAYSSITDLPEGLPSLTFG